jgi:transcriptional regulator with XRE-family HTH domain
MICQPYLGNLLREQRVHSKQTLRAVSRNAKISHSHLEKIETGKVEPSTATLLRLLDASHAPNDLVLEIFGVTVRDKPIDDQLAKSILSKVFIEAGLAFESPTPGRNRPDFILHLGTGRVVFVEVKNSPRELASKRD